QPYPDHPDRFDVYRHLLCRTGVTGRCYWEVKWKGNVSISVSYREISRKGNYYDCGFGENDQSWSLRCSDDDHYSVCHNNRKTSIDLPLSSVSHRVGVYVDCPASTLSYKHTDTHTHKHTNIHTPTHTHTHTPTYTHQHTHKHTNTQT
ncbi:hypothetical protein LDENG_00023200, partial [Lucifuga dentata]